MLGEYLATEADMIQAGVNLATELSDRDHAVIALIGQLGAGKTHFVKGLAQGLGIADDVSSPTFSLVQEYLQGNKPLYHFDFYRIEADEELLDLGWDDYLQRPGIIVVEWADRYPNAFPADTHWLELRHHDANSGRVLQHLTIHFEK